MDQSQFQHAQELYQAGDYRQAAKAFLAAAGRGAQGNGSAYHMAGNALMRLRRYNDAVSVYKHALRDDSYPRRGAVYVNLGQAQCQAGEYADAIASYDCAVDDPDYTTPYKALQGRAGALFEMGKVADAAGAYRSAAIDPVNPDPGKALNNLGLCFMALGRPADAAEAYKAALGFDQYKGRGKALSNLGQAFVAMGEWDDAVRAFSRATQLHSYALSPSARADYELALEETGAQPPLLEPDEDAEFSDLIAGLDAEAEGDSAGVALPAGPAVAAVASAAAVGTEPTPSTSVFDVSASPDPHEKVDGWQTGEMVPAPLTQPTSEFMALDSIGWSTDELKDMTGVPDAFADDVTPDFDTSIVDSSAAAAENLGIGDEEAVDAFFSMTDAEMKQRDKEQRKAEKAERRAGRSPLMIVLGVVVGLLAIVAVVAGAWFFGLGWPTQTQTATGLMTAYQNGGSVDGYWVAVPQRDVAKEMAKIPPPKSSSVDEVQRGATDSSVIVTITPVRGAPLRYKLTMAREGVGWKVTGVDNDWSSVGQ